MFNGRLVKRAWGFYVTLLDRKHFKVKFLWFKKGKSCSMQKHSYRHELWLFLRGGGMFDLSTLPPFIITKHDYLRVPKNEWHRFTAEMPTLVLEIQYGERCDEEDIIRV